MNEKKRVVLSWFSKGDSDLYVHDHNNMIL